MKKFWLTALTVAALPLAASTAPALAKTAPVFGSYNVTFYLEPNRTTGATQCIVFNDTGSLGGGVTASGSWTSPTFSGWSGQYIQEGDHIRWYGFTSGGLATSETGNVLNGSLIGGQDFNHFLNGSTSSLGNWLMVKVNSCSNARTIHSANADPTGAR